MTVVELRNITKVYRRGGLLGKRRSINAVNGASLKIERGKCLALVGPSGSGKSTLGRILLGLEKPDAGEILYKGRPAAELRREARRAVQAVFQNSQGSVDPRFTARDIIAEPLVNFDRLSGPALDDKVAGLLADVGLDPADMGKYPHQFSGGELQRICIARALAPGPEVIVLDEAVSSLDMLNQSRVMELLSRIRETSGTAFLFVTHDMRLVAAIADSLAVMENGEITAATADLAGAAPSGSLLFHQLAAAVLPGRPQPTEQT